MLRDMMWDRKTGDKDFVDMMHDFVAKFTNKNASTADFEHLVEQHMKPDLDLDGNGGMNWFFKEWVFGTEIPAYHLKYSLTAAANGKTLLTGTITQSGVSPNFRMLVPVYLDYDGRLVRVGSARLAGSTSQDIKVVLPKKPKRVVVNAMHDVLASESVSAGS
jgi:aminopeptidase N